jgi:hypothetical protein
MNEAFADTFYWLAVLNPNDAQHGKAMQFNEPVRLVMSWAAQIEVMDALCEQPMRPLAARFWKETTEDQDQVLVPLTEDLLHRAAILYASRLDKAWSMTDCISFVIIRQRGIAQTPTGDHHFEQAGFLALLR